VSDADLKVDDFQLAALIANGNSSQVWEVRDVAGQSFAMKLLLPDALKNPEQVNVLKHEAKVGQSLEHPNFLRVFKFVKTKTHCYMLMELFKVANLKGMLQNEPIAAQGRFGRLSEQLCTALGFMHEKGWLHHDLKPDNILFDKSSALKVIDFSLSMRKQGGLGKVFSGKVKVIQGTRTYIAPETIQKQYPTPQSDIYSLGVTLFEVLAGQPPFTGNTPHELLRKHVSVKAPEPSAFNPNVTPEADKVITRMLAKKPAHRPKDLAEVASELRAIKVFKVEPFELAAAEEAKLKAGGGGLDSKSRLDSRADAERVAAGIAAPAKPQARKATASAIADAARHAAKNKPAAPQQPEYPPGYQPAWPGYAPQPAYWAQYPGMPVAPAQGEAQPYYQYPPAAPVPYPPQQPAPHGGQYPPGYPPQPMPQQPVSPQFPPAQTSPAGPAPGQPAAPQAARPATPPPAAPVQPGARPAPQYSSPGQGRSLNERHPTQADVTDDDLPMMEELPDVI